jgi:cell division protein FtsL
MTRGAAIGTVFGVFFLTVVLAMALVWVNIERVDLAYDLQKMQTELSKKEELAAKLEIERNNLAAPARLRQLAADAGLYEARSGQMRKIKDPGYDRSGWN